jgi:LuxR family transcriptional regulator, quorum-sensing system regulator CviR
LEVFLLKIDKWISNEDAHTLFEIINDTFLCKSEEDYKKLIEQTKKLLFFDYSISGLMDLRRISYDNLLSTSINSGYPSEYLKTYVDNKYQFKDPLYIKFFETLEVQNTNELYGVYNYGPEHPVYRLREDFGIINVYLYGIGDVRLNYFAGINIAGQKIKNDQRTKMIIKYLSPFLLAAVLRLVQCTFKKDIKPLTPSELAVLNWLKEGKSSWEISVILKKSERSINFHITNILKKLNASNRTHAVVIALENNLITI